jgi:hypothetical protein
VKQKSKQSDWWFLKINTYTLQQAWTYSGRGRCRDSGCLWFDWLKCTSMQINDMWSEYENRHPEDWQSHVLQAEKYNNAMISNQKQNCNSRDPFHPDTHAIFTSVVSFNTLTKSDTIQQVSRPFPSKSRLPPMPRPTHTTSCHRAVLLSVWT